jgi:hypothetical protein
MKPFPNESVQAVKFFHTRSRWTPGHRQLPERGQGQRRAKLFTKVEQVGWKKALKVELTYGKLGRFRDDGTRRPEGELFDLAKQRRDVGEFIRRLRVLGYGRVEYYKATEFHKDGEIHFHVILLGYRRIPKAILDKAWKWGFTWIRKLDKDGAAYATKGLCYATKGIDNDAFPQYLIGRSAGTRLSSTSRGFWGAPKPKLRRHVLIEKLKSRQSRRSGIIPTIGQVRTNPDNHVRMHIEMMVQDGDHTRSIRRAFKQNEPLRACQKLRELGFEATPERTPWGETRIGWWVRKDVPPACAGGGVGASRGNRAGRQAGGLSLDQSQYCGALSPIDLQRIFQDGP